MKIKRAFNFAYIYAKEGDNFDNKYLKYKNSEDLGLNFLQSKKELTPEELINKWYEKEKNYNYQEPQDFDEFTQMIWKNSEKFGIGYYPDNNGNKDNNVDNNDINDEKDIYYIALFYPEGNKLLDFRENVLRPKPVMEANAPIGDNIGTDILNINEKNNNSNLKDKNPINKDLSQNSSKNKDLINDNKNNGETNNGQNQNDNSDKKILNDEKHDKDSLSEKH